jgi:hypothetical protein
LCGECGGELLERQQDSVEDDPFDERGFVREVVVDACLRGAGSLGDLLRRQVGEAALRDDRECRLEDRLPDPPGWAPTRSSGRSLAHQAKPKRSEPWTTY